MEINPLAKLDIVLEFLRQKETPPKATMEEITEGVFDKIQNETEVLQIVNKLIKDEYIDKEDIPVTQVGSYLIASGMLYKTYYMITFEGVFFLEYPGGYEKKEEFNSSENTRLEKLERDQIKRDKNIEKFTSLIAWGTVGAALVGLALLGWQVYSYYHQL
jgi:hypothetical protein